MKMLRQKNKKEKGFTIIEVVISIAIFLMITLALVNMFSSVLRTLRGNKAILTANSIAVEQMEIIRGMEFNKVATQSGFVPAGDIVNQKTLLRGGINYIIRTDISWVDDPFDGLLPTDTFSWDYKKVRVRISWTNPISLRTEEFSASTNIVPVGLEGLNEGMGGIYLSAFDAEGVPVFEADVQITRVNHPEFTMIEGTTDLNGNLWVPDLDPTVDNNNYHIVVTKDGYSLDQTYAINNDPVSPNYNPSPAKADAIVVVQRVTQLGFAIDELGVMNIKTVYFANPANWQINTASAFSQSSPAMAFDASGHLFVAFVDDRDGASHIYLRRFTYNAGDGTYGSPWASDVRIVNQVDCASPKLKVLPDGSLYALWTDKRDGEEDIYLQEINPVNGALMGGEFMVNHDSGAYVQQNADMDADQDGNLYIVWEDYRGAGWDIYSQKFAAATSTFWPSDTKVNATETGDQINAKIILDRDTDGGGANLNNYYVTWQSNQNGNFDVMLSKFSGDHVAAFEEHIINSDGGVLGQTNPDMIYDGSAYLYIVWEDERNASPDIYAQKMDKSGNRIWAIGDIKINNDAYPTARRTKPSVGYHSDTDIYVSWEDNRNGDSYSNIYTSKINAAGVRAWTDYDLIISDKLESMQKNVSTLCDAGGKAVTVWQDDKSGDDNIYAARYSDMGDVIKPFATVRVISEKAKGTYGDPEVPIPKYSREFTSDAGGNTYIGSVAGGLEWGNYIFSVELPNKIISYDLPSPIYVAPGGEASIVINIGT